MRTRNDPLTDAQSRLVEANIRMAGAVLKKHKNFVRQVGYDEAYSFACLVLCKAVRTFDPAKATLGTHFYEHFRLMAISYYQGRVVPIDRLTYFPEMFDSVTATSPDDGQHPLNVQDQLVRCLSFVSYRDRCVLELLYGIVDGHKYKFGEVAKVMGVSRSRVGQIHELAIRKLRLRTENAQWESPRTTPPSSRQ